MTGSRRFTDASCYHAAFTVLLDTVAGDAGPRPEGHAEGRTTNDAVAVLGANALTGARLDDTGLLVFDDPFEVLSLVFARCGHPLVRHPVDGAAAWEAAEQALAASRTVAAAADPFHLRYYWPSYGKSHDLHTVVLRELDPRAATVRLLDAGEEVFFDGRVPLAEIRAAMYGDDSGQSWVELGSRPGERRPPADELERIAEELAGPPGRWLSGTGLVETLTARLDDYLRAVRERPRARTGERPAPTLGRALPLGLLWYGHTLRWLACRLPVLRVTAGTVDAVERAARDVVVANSLMMRLGVLPPGTPRATAFRTQLDTRLASMARDLGSAGAELSDRARAGAETAPGAAV